MIEAVIFDLFGTLIRLSRDSSPYFQLCRAIRASGRIRDSLVVDAPTLVGFCDLIGADQPANLADLQRELEADIESATLYSDTLESLRALRDRDIRIGVISNLASPYKQAVARLGLDSLVDALVYSCDLGIAKPQREIYLAALAELDVRAENAIMVGDNQRSDVDGPMACGMRGYLLDRDGRSKMESSLSSLQEVVRLASD